MRWFVPNIVMLHHVSDQSCFHTLEPYAIGNQSFVKLLDYIQFNNYRTLTFRDLINNKSIKKSVVITFDDCSRELLNFAIPELMKRNMKAVFFIPTNFIDACNQWDVQEGRDKVDLFTKQDIIDVSLNPNFEIGSHSKSHTKLSQLAQDEVLKELKESKALLERLINKEIISFAHPFGDLPAKNTYLLEKAGYYFGCGIYVKKSNNYSLRRFIYHNGDNKFTLFLKLSRSYQLYRFFRDKI